MVPATSSPSLNRTRTGTSFSIKCFRYLTSSNVCSGARVPDFPLLFCVMLSLLLFARSHRNPRTWRPGVPFGFPIISIASRHTQIGTAKPQLQAVKFVLGQRNIPGIKAQQVLGSKVTDDLGERAVQARTDALRMHAPTRVQD